MLNHVEEPGRPLTLADVERVECIGNVVFPSDYRKFLLAHNGGRPVPSAFPLFGLDKNPYGNVHYFFGIENNGDDDSCDLLSIFEIMRDRLPGNLIAIADDGCGDLICLSVSGEDVGAVVFWNQHNVPETPDYSNVYFIANSFSDFLDSLCELPDDYE